MPTPATKPMPRRRELDAYLYAPAIVRYTVMALGVALVAGVAGAGCRDKPTTEQCERLLAHTVELYAAPRGLKLLAAEQKAQYDASLLGLRKKLGDDFMARCRRDDSPASVACQLQARTLEQLAECWPAP